MKVVDLDGHISQLSLVGYCGGNQRKNRSTYHIRARKFLHSTFSTQQILEEVSIVVRKGRTLYLDFFLPLIKLAVEVHGEQHFKFIPMFHGDRFGYIRQCKNDSDKISWCQMNNIDIVVLPCYNNIKEWYDILRDGLKIENKEI